jgi:Protein of unknown function (DUF3455)
MRRGVSWFVIPVILIAGWLSASAQAPDSQVTPKQLQSVAPQLQPPANEQLALQVHAKGDQIYSCKESSSHDFAWALKAPDAQLFDKDGKPFGKHFAGPTWQANDGSSVTGKAVANASPDPDSIPWLLVTVVNHSGEGVLSKINFIQRVNTIGGKAPGTGCDSTHTGQEVRVSYSADYRFFAPK